MRGWQVQIETIAQIGVLLDGAGSGLLRVLVLRTAHAPRTRVRRSVQALQRCRVHTEATGQRIRHGSVHGHRLRSGCLPARVVQSSVQPLLPSPSLPSFCAPLPSRLFSYDPSGICLSLVFSLVLSRPFGYDQVSICSFWVDRFRRFSAQAPASKPPLVRSAVFSVFTEMAEFTKFDDAQVSGQPPISEELMTLLTAATVGFRALGNPACGRVASLADDRH